MADVEISYNGDTIVSMSDSGTEYLDTKGKFMTDNITVNYTKSGGGGASTTEVMLAGQNVEDTYYFDGTSYQAVSLFGMPTSITAVSGSVISLGSAGSTVRVLSGATKLDNYTAIVN